jgi:phospholipase C
MSARLLLAGLLMLTALALTVPSVSGRAVLRLFNTAASSANAVAIDQARAKIKHVVFVLLENHSFDNLFGRFPGADGTTTARSDG